MRRARGQRVTKCVDVDRANAALIIARFMRLVSIVKNMMKYDGTDGKKTERNNGGYH